MIGMAGGHDIVFLLDVDNTLFDNDRFSHDLDARLLRDFGADGRKRYRQHYQALRDAVGYADYLGAVQRLRADFDDDPDLLQLAAFILDYPFAEGLYPGALDAVAHLHLHGMPAILSDGDIVLQPRKIQRSGLWQAVAGQVAITLHKQHETQDVQQRWPAGHYVMIEDKPLLLAQMKKLMGAQLTTVFIQQGHYAVEQGLSPGDPAADIVLARISDLRSLTARDFIAAAAGPAVRHLEQP